MSRDLRGAGVRPFHAAGEAFGAAVDRIATLDARFLLPALALQLGTLVLKSVAWRNVLAAAHPSTHVPLFRIGCAYVAGAALNAFTPARGGDAVKVVLARAQIERSTLASVTGSLAAVSALDGAIGLALVVGLWAGGVVPAVPAPSLPHGTVVLVLAAAVAVSLVVFGLRFRAVALRLVRGLAQGFAVFRSPGRYAATVLPFQLAGWACRIGVVLLVLAAFRIPAGLDTAALIVTLSGVSTAVPIPGGGGAQQVLAAFALQGVTTVAGAVSFSLGLQMGVTAVNTTIGIVGAMLLFGTLRPDVAIQAAGGPHAARKAGEAAVAGDGGAWARRLAAVLVTRLRFGTDSGAELDHTARGQRLRGFIEEARLCHKP